MEKAASQEVHGEDRGPLLLLSHSSVSPGRGPGDPVVRVVAQCTLSASRLLY